MIGSIAILEDDPWRIAEMRACLPELLPGVQHAIFEDAGAMIVWLREHLSEVILISLDHDLPITRNHGESIDQGTGRQVADFLARMPPTCPVIIHSSNPNYAPGMFFTLAESGWPIARVYPTDDADWIRRDWGAQVLRFIRDGWIELR